MKRKAGKAHRISLFETKLASADGNANRRGQSVVELALVVPLLLLLLVGVIEIGRYASYSIVVSNAARAGAQYGAQNLATAADTAGIQAASLNDATGAAGLTVTPAQRCGCSNAIVAGAAPTAKCPAACLAPDHALVYVQVKTSGSMNSLFKYPGIPRTFTVSSTELMRVAQ